MINKEKLDEEIVIMKKSVAKLVREKDREYIGKIEKFNQMVVLAAAEFKCQKPLCGSEIDLQIHHLIMRASKKYMDFWRYVSQRYYWANQIVLCKKHHKEHHKEMGADAGENRECISKARINKIKKRFK